MDKKILKVVITGGPCAGKTTIMSRIEKEFIERGWKVLIVPETATELISNGIKPFDDCLDNKTFQEILLKKQLDKENLYDEIIELLPHEKILILYDRGILDGKAYIEEEIFNSILKLFKKKEQYLKEKYDGIIHLVTAANGAPEFYTLENNTSRTEDVDKAIELDNNTLNAWVGHPKLRVIDNSTDFDNKIKRALKEIYVMSGEPIPVEIERKYLIKKPNIEELLRQTNCTILEIIQNYLISNDDKVERRIRLRGKNNDYTYTYTQKTKINELERYEIEKRLSSKEYINLLAEVDNNLKTIKKTRYCFVYNNQYFELDIYQECEDKAILEIELNSVNQEIEIPKFLEVIKEVTEDNRYKNYSLSKEFNL